jgi:hypothetical protein
MGVMKEGFDHVGAAVAEEANEAPQPQGAALHTANQVWMGGDVKEERGGGVVMKAKEEHATQADTVVISDFWHGWDGEKGGFKEEWMDGRTDGRMDG